MLILLLGVIAALLHEGAAFVMSRKCWGLVVDQHAAVALRPLPRTVLQEGRGGGSNSCVGCKGKGVVACKPCIGTGVDKVNGSLLERWCCKRCKGFGLVPCGSCSSSTGLTPEQRGER